MKISSYSETIPILVFILQGLAVAKMLCLLLWYSVHNHPSAVGKYWKCLTCLQLLIVSVYCAGTASRRASL